MRIAGTAVQISQVFNNTRSPDEYILILFHREKVIAAKIES